jgi:hypothetical protein
VDERGEKLTVAIDLKVDRWKRKGVLVGRRRHLYSWEGQVDLCFALSCTSFLPRCWSCILACLWLWVSSDWMDVAQICLRPCPDVTSHVEISLTALLQYQRTGKNNFLASLQSRVVDAKYCARSLDIVPQGQRVPTRYPRIHKSQATLLSRIKSCWNIRRLTYLSEKYTNRIVMELWTSFAPPILGIQPWLLSIETWTKTLTPTLSTIS